jgi:PAS domain S-box-containing protein
VAIPVEQSSSEAGSLSSGTLVCLIGRDYQFQQLNQGWQFLLGWAPEEIRARSFLEWLHPDDRRIALDEFHRLGVAGEAVAFDARVTSKKSLYPRISWNAFALPDPQGICAIGRELPPPPAPSEAVRVKLSSAPDGIILLSGENRVALISAETEAVRRVLRTDPRGQSLEILIPRSLLASDPGRPQPLELSLGPAQGSEAKDRPQATEFAWVNGAEHAPDALILRGSDDIVTGWNRAAEDLYGYTRTEVVGQPIARLVPPELVSEDRRVRARLVRGERVPPYDTERLRKDGSRIEVSVSVTPLSIDGAPAAQFMELGRDLSDRKREERRLNRRADDLTRSNAELKDYASVLAHDLQEPLHATAAYLEDLRSRFADPLGKEGADVLSLARDSVEWMRGLSRDLLKYARLEIPDEAMEATEVEKVLQEVLTNLHPQTQEANAQILMGPLPVVHAHRTQLAQVFQNLLSNALKFRSPEPPQIRLEAEERPGEVLFRISDNGIGIDPGRLRQIFGPSLKRHEGQPFPGLGMGLAIARKIVERHGGRIWAEATVGRGSTFFFALPARRERGPA